MLRIEADGVEFSCLTAGPDDGPLALCLHGFPDSAHTYDDLMARLAGAGYRAVAPFMRGYAPTGPVAGGTYQRGRLGLDALALHDALGGDERAIVIGHDWGALATHVAIAHQPDRWRKAVMMALPPLAVFAAGLGGYAQQKRSFYVWLFQLGLADSWVRADDLAFIDGLWRDWGPNHAAAPDHVKEALRPDGCLEAAMGYYRAFFRPEETDPSLAAADAAAFVPTGVPTLYLHGDADGCFMFDPPASIEDAMPHLAPGSSVMTVSGAGHFLHLDDPDATWSAISAFLDQP